MGHPQAFSQVNLPKLRNMVQRICIVNKKKPEGSAWLVGIRSFEPLIIPSTSRVLPLLVF
jgi:hypothetical protein